MIRPFTLVCMLMAGGAGLYLYQTKHQAQMMDREIGKTLKLIDQARERIGMLKAEWALLNEPSRLEDLSRAHLGLRPLLPTQFVALNDLASKLPAPVAPKPVPEPEPEQPAPALVAEAPAAPAPMPAPAPAKPAAAKPAPVAVAAADPKPAPESKPAKPAPDLKLADAKPAPVRPRPVQVAAVPVHPVIAAPITPVAISTAATAPGTVGAAVLRAMRARAEGYAPAPTYAPVPAYAPAPQAAYVQPAYAAAPIGSLLGSTRSSLPPPVPFGGR